MSLSLSRLLGGGGTPIGGVIQMSSAVPGPVVEIDGQTYLKGGSYILDGEAEYPEAFARMTPNYSTPTRTQDNPSGFCGVTEEAFIYYEVGITHVLSDYGYFKYHGLSGSTAVLGIVASGNGWALVQESGTTSRFVLINLSEKTAVTCAITGANPAVNTVGFATSTHLFIAGNSGYLYKVLLSDMFSNPASVSSTNLSLYLQGPEYGITPSVTRVGSRILIAGNVNTYKSEDNGATWSGALGASAQKGLYYSEYDSLYFAMDVSTSGVKTSSTGATWSLLTPPAGGAADTYLVKIDTRVFLFRSTEGRFYTLVGGIWEDFQVVPELTGGTISYWGKTTLSTSPISVTVPNQAFVVGLDTSGAIKTTPVCRGRYTQRDSDGNGITLPALSNLSASNGVKPKIVYQLTRSKPDGTATLPLRVFIETNSIGLPADNGMAGQGKESFLRIK